MLAVSWREVGTEKVFREEFTDRLDAAHTISAVGRYVNLELVAVECDDSFREYCAALKPGGVRW
jgi:hypothetical protein